MPVGRTEGKHSKSTRANMCRAPLAQESPDMCCAPVCDTCLGTQMISRARRRPWPSTQLTSVDLASGRE
jgi:hypothetical protein